jgi:methylmalonyl-CoA mutase N-terminal domain/subunit
MSDSKQIEERLQRWEGEEKIGDIPPIVDLMGYQHKVLYTPLDVKDTYLNDLGFSGEYPFTRGVYPAMYRKALMRFPQYAGFGTAEDTNRRWKYLIGHGQMTVNLAFDLPTHMGIDSDDPVAEDEVGRVGVAIDSLRDFEVLFDGIPLVPAFFNTVGPASILLAMYIATGEKKGLAPSNVMGAFTNDILAICACRGNWIFPIKPSLRLITDMTEYCCRNMPRFYPQNIQGVYFRAVGSSLPQEVGYTFADAFTYIDEALARGLDIDEFAPRLSFFISCGPEFLAEAAKFRATRRLWARLMRERYDPKDKNSLRIRMTSATGGAYFQAIEPLNNLARGAYAILGAALGGCQATFIAGYDEAYAIPTEETARLGLRTVQILAEETDLARTVDPLAGSYYIENLTDYIEQEALKYLHQIEDAGGAAVAVESGFMRRELDKMFEIQHGKRLSGEIPVVGVNKYVHEGEEEKEPEIHKPNPEAVRIQLERLEQVRSQRDGAEVKKLLKRIRQAARGEENLIPPFIEAVKAYATLGEIVSVLKEEFGEFEEPRFIF